MASWKAFGAWALLGASVVVVGCKSAPDLAQADATKLIQAKYEQAPAAGLDITLQKAGLDQGITAKYWQLTRIYPNRYWADYTLTPEGKKVVKLPAGGDVIHWQPETADDQKYSVIVTTVATTHPKVRDVKDAQDEVLPGADTAKGAEFTEAVNFEGIPAPLQDIAHNPGNKLVSKRHADFAVDGGAWKLKGIQ
jgi:hypothetical protein